ncbi:hypothetical protein GE061_019267 [Apolygus lucorum]|uniref:Uncharacterized protein n=1 Tax=Apolygus lucorum TaxID=248454 RepID=A0A6A4JNF9_APOLU|nr:hypothetical protein GE061_019267 [Apolygus lucorum]
MAIDFRSVCHSSPELFDRPTPRSTLLVLCAQYDHNQVWRPGTSGGIEPGFPGIGDACWTDRQEIDMIRRIFFCCMRKSEDEAQTREQIYAQQAKVRPSRTSIEASSQPLLRELIKLPTPKEAEAINQDMVKAMAQYRALSIVASCSQDVFGKMTAGGSNSGMPPPSSSVEQPTKMLKKSEKPRTSSGSSDGESYLESTPSDVRPTTSAKQSKTSRTSSSSRHPPPKPPR